MYRIIRSLLFLLPAERAHGFTTWMLDMVCKLPGVPRLLKNLYEVKDGILEQHLFGLDFKNPVGLAAGFDKNAEHIKALSNLGFGFLEVGTITPESQPGNPKPRLFRLKEDIALINRMGFNNEGMERVAINLKDRPPNVIIGGNIGKNKKTENDDALSDYKKCFLRLYPNVDYFVVNVSSPNTPGLRALQEREPLEKLLQSLVNERENFEMPKPILLKIAPDMENLQLDNILEIINTTCLDGIIVTNTTVKRDALKTNPKKLKSIGRGGLSGKPLRCPSTNMIKYIRDRNTKIPIIGVGGIINEATALEKWRAGANLLQVYTGFVYEGPGLIKKINKAISKEIRGAV